MICEDDLKGVYFVIIRLPDKIKYCRCIVYTIQVGIVFLLFVWMLAVVIKILNIISYYAYSEDHANEQYPSWGVYANPSERAYEDIWTLSERLNSD